LRWLYLLTVIIPTLLGMMTTLVILSIAIGPPTAILSTPVPPDLYITSANYTKIGRDYAIIIRVYNPGDQGLYILNIYANNKLVYTKHTYIEPHMTKELSFVLPRKMRGRINVTIIWTPEQGTAPHRTTTFINVPRK